MDKHEHDGGKSPWLHAGMAIVGILILMAFGILVGMKIGNDRRMEIRSAAAAESAAAESRQLAESRALAESIETAASQKSYAESKALMEAEEKAREEETQRLLKEQSDARNEKSAEVIKGIIKAGISNVAAFYDASQNTAAALEFNENNSLADNTESEGESGNAITPSTVTNGKIVCIDPGHQDHGMSDKEPNGPGSSVMKAKLTTGTSGISTGIAEYVVNLQVSLALRDALEARGYTVVMTRETNDVNISNAERAQIADSAQADIFLRIHCNSSTDSPVKGVLAYEPSSSNPYLSQTVIAESQRLSRNIVSGQTSSTGQNSLGIITGDDMTGINWAAMPVTIIEMGFMSNPGEDQYLCSADGQAAIVEGLADGVDAYFNGQQ